MKLTQGLVQTCPEGRVVFVIRTAAVVSPSSVSTIPPMKEEYLKLCCLPQRYGQREAQGRHPLLPSSLKCSTGRDFNSLTCPRKQYKIQALKPLSSSFLTTKGSQQNFKLKVCEVANNGHYGTKRNRLLLFMKKTTLRPIEANNRRRTTEA